LGNTISTMNGKGRRVTSNVATGSSLRDVTTARAISTTGRAGSTSQDGNQGIQWSTFDPSILHGYRHDYRLNTPAAFSNPYHQLILSRPGIGRMSPTMTRRKEQGRQSKEQLANSVRKHFNSMGIVENEVVVDFLYKVRWQDKNFRMRFAPQRSR
jgi:hypothetical protein